MWGFLMSMLSGALMSLQGVFNTKVTESSSIWAAAGFVQITGFLTCLVLWFVTGRGNVAGIFQVNPKIALFGGVIGAFITITVVMGMKQLGPAQATLLIVITQLAVSYVVELFGWFGMEQVDFSWRKLLGLLVAAAGILLFRWE